MDGKGQGCGTRTSLQRIAGSWKSPQSPELVAGPNQRAQFDDGSFMGSTVCLGEIRTDAAGRLLVLGGHGVARTYDATMRIKSATDNDGWHDDVSDGPVSAVLALEDGRVVSATPAWVVVTPPEFAPGLRSIATQFDVLVDQAIGQGVRPDVLRPSFQHNILPILRRIADMQWLDSRALESFAGSNGKGGRAIEASLPSLATNGADRAEVRQAVFAEVSRVCRIVSGSHPNSQPDNGAVADRWLELTATQYRMLRLWSVGDFEPDWCGEIGANEHAAMAPPSPDWLDRAALEACASGALYADPQQLAIDDIFMPGESFRLDHRKVSPGDMTRSMALPWHADVFERSTPAPALLCPRDVLIQQTFDAVCDLDRQIAALPGDGTEDERLRTLRERREALWTTRQPWARGLATRFPSREESLIKEWQHLGFIAAHGLDGSEIRRDGAACRIEVQRSRYLASMAEYFHRLVNFEEHPDFAPKALELAVQMLGDAKFGTHARLSQFRYTPEAFDERLEQIYADLVDSEMYNPITWESGEISWDAIVDYDEDDQPIWKSRRFHIGRFSDAALRERFRQFAPQNMTDGAWLQNIIAAAPMDGVQARLASIWIDEAGGGRVEQNHSNVYAALMHSQNIYLPPVTAREFIEQDFVRSAFESPVFQLCVGRFPRRFLPELLGMTLYMEWEATPTSTPIANMLAKRGFDPLYYRMHAAIDNIDAGHGALSKEAIKLYLNAKLKEGGDAVVQEHWQRIWRGYVAWSTLGNGADEIVERMMTIDRKQIHIQSALLVVSDILPPLLRALQTAQTPLPHYLRERIGSATQIHLAAWTLGEALSDALRDCLRRDLNECIRAGIYEPTRFAGIELSGETQRLLKLQPKNGVDLLDLGRCLLEDAFPDGIVRRAGFPDLRQHAAAKMMALLRAKTPVAVQSHRRVRWLTTAFKSGPEAVMQSLLDHGFIDIAHPGNSRLFEKTQFDGPMFKVFSDEDKATIIEWIESLRVAAPKAVHPEPGVPVVAVDDTTDLNSPAADMGFDDCVVAERAPPRPDRGYGELRRRTGMGSVH